MTALWPWCPDRVHMLPRFLGTGLWLQFDGDLQQFYSRAWRLLSKEEQAAHPMQGSSDHGSPQYLPGSLAADLEEALKSRPTLAADLKEAQNSGNAGSDGTSSAVNELASLLNQELPTEKETEPKKNGGTKKKKKKKKKKQTKPKEDL